MQARGEQSGPKAISLVDFGAKARRILFQKQKGVDERLAAVVPVLAQEAVGRPEHAFVARVVIVKADHSTDLEKTRPAKVLGDITDFVGRIDQDEIARDATAASPPFDTLPQGNSRNRKKQKYRKAG